MLGTVELIASDVSSSVLAPAWPTAVRTVDKTVTKWRAMASFSGRATVMRSSSGRERQPVRHDRNSDG